MLPHNIQGEEQDHSLVKEDSLINIGDPPAILVLPSTKSHLNLVCMETQNTTKASQRSIDSTFNNPHSSLWQPIFAYHLNVLPLSELSGTLATPPACSTSKA